MQSSPPTRAWERQSSPAGSQYSLDLGALDIDAQSDSSDRIPKPKIDRIFSEDIDGPSDFTQNMEMWMNGGTFPKGTPQGKGASKESAADQDHGVKRRDFLYTPQKEAGNGDDEDISQHTPNIGLPKEPDRAKLGPHEEHFSSEWDTYEAASTPAVAGHQQLLQPTVEDYYSELTIAHQTPAPTLRGRRSHMSRRSIPDMQKQSPSKESTPGRASSPTLSPVRSPIMKRTKGREEEALPEEGNQQDDELEAQVKQLEAKCQQLELQNGALSQAIDEERRMRRQEKAAHETQSAQAARRGRDLTEIKDTAHTHNEEFRREFAQLKQRVREQDEELARAKGGAQDDRRNHDAEIQRLGQQLKQQKEQHSEAMKACKEDVEQARQQRVTAEHATRMQRKELDQQRELHEADMERLRVELKDASEDAAAVAKLEEQLRTAREEIQTWEKAGHKADATLTSLRAQIASTKQAHREDIARSTTERGRAVDLAVNLQRQLQDLRAELRQERDSHEKEMQRVKSEHQQAQETSSKELDVIRAEHEAKQSEFNEVVLDRDEAQDALQASQAEVEELKGELGDIRAANTALDASVRAAIQARDKRWKEKLEAVHKEKKMVSTALLRQWGREEMGVQSPQEFAYKFSAGKTGPVKVKAKVVS